MAITNAQQYKQLMQKGGRIGLRGGGADMGKSNDGAKKARARSGYGPSPDSKPDRSRTTDTQDRRTADATGKNPLNIDFSKDPNLTPREIKRIKQRDNFFNIPKGKTGGVGALNLLFGPMLTENAIKTRKFFSDPNFTGTFGNRRSVLDAGKFTYNGQRMNQETFNALSPDEQEEVYSDYISRRQSGEIDAAGNPMAFSTGGIDAKSAGAERGDLTTLPLVQDKVIPEVEEEDPTAYRFLADGGRAAFQEGGGIFPRLNQLGSNVSSAEQELAALSQKINSAESTLGEGGGDEGGLGSIMPENNFTNPTLEAFSGTNINVKGGPEGFDNFPDGFGTRPNLDAQLRPNFKPSGTLQATTGGGLLNNFFAPGIDPMGSRKENPTGTVQTFTAPSTNLPGSGAPQAGDVVYDPTGMPNIYAPRNGYADGGMSEYEGGIMDLESGRQQYFLGKLVKKAKKTIGKIYKSPLGKAALLGLGAQGLMSGKGLGIKDFLTRSFLGKEVTPGNRTGGILEFIKNNKALTGIAAGSLAAGLTAPKQSTYDAEEEDEFYLDRFRADPEKYLAKRFYANGGRIGYSSGSEDLSKNKVYQKWVQRYEANPDSPLVTMHEKADVFKNFYERNKNAQAEGSKEPVAKETMPLLDMDGEEMDLRAEGGFVPIGRMEKADDVPARLSKNEFVFTADAVRNAGEGDVDKGAEVMYNMMKNLEAGGEVSEESQGLEGAKRMFQTSQRLEEVL